MFAALLLCAGSLAVSPSTADMASYESARPAAGRDPEAHVKLALWCEAHGLEAERLKHLAIAVLVDPAHATARGLMGLVAFRGRWQRPDAVGEQVKADGELAALLEAYQQKRAVTPFTAEGQWKLALWCEENGLKDEAKAHLLAVLQLDPSRDAAWRRLGYKKQDGRWTSDEEIAARKAEAERAREADRRWTPRLERLRDRLSVKGRRVEAEDALAEISDPGAVPSICRVFKAGEANQRVAARLLGQVDSPGSSRALASLAVFSPFAEVRRAAAETLVRRDPREFVDGLVGLLRDPIKYEVRPVGGPGSPGTLFVEGKRFNLKRLYSPPPGPSILPGDRPTVDEFGFPAVSRNLGYYTLRSGNGLGWDVNRLRADPQRLSGVLAAGGLSAADSQQLGQRLANNANAPFDAANRMARGRGGRFEVTATVPRVAEVPVGRMMAEAQQAAQVAEGQLEADVAAIKAYNAPILERNQRVTSILTKVAGEDLGGEPESWRTWATDLMGYANAPQKASQETPTVTVDVPIAFQPQATPIVSDGPPVIQVVRRHSCFGGGTLVSTLSGPRPIETLRIGDKVLTQDVATGGLSYQPVVAVYHNPPNATVRVDLGDDSVVATGIHRFWRAGRGWTMARDLKPGDVVRTLGGVATVAAVREDRNQPVFNLQVAGGQSFFVGKAGTLVHDNSIVTPVTDPFDAEPNLEAIARAK